MKRRKFLNMLVMAAAAISAGMMPKPKPKPTEFREWHGEISINDGNIDDLVYPWRTDCSVSVYIPVSTPFGTRWRRVEPTYEEMAEIRFLNLTT